MTERPKARLWLKHLPQSFYDQLQKDIDELDKAYDSPEAAAMLRALEPRLLCVKDGGRYVDQMAAVITGTALKHTVKRLDFFEGGSYSPAVRVLLSGGGVATFVGCAVAAFVALGTMQRARESHDWPSVPGTIHTIQIEAVTTSSGPAGSGKAHQSTTHHHVKATYAYSVDGDSHMGTRFDFTGISFSKRSDAKAFSAKYPPGTKVDVYYRPGEPQAAVLFPGPTWHTELIPYGLLLFSGIGVAIALYRVRTTRLQMGLAIATTAFLEAVLFVVARL